MKKFRIDYQWQNKSTISNNHWNKAFVIVTENSKEKAIKEFIAGSGEYTNLKNVTICSSNKKPITQRKFKFKEEEADFIRKYLIDLVSDINFIRKHFIDSRGEIL